MWACVSGLPRVALPVEHQVGVIVPAGVVYRDERHPPFDQPSRPPLHTWRVRAKQIAEALEASSETKEPVYLDDKTSIPQFGEVVRQ